MPQSLSRRGFLGGAVAASALPAASRLWGGSNRAKVKSVQLYDFHVHLDDTVTLDKALERSRETGVKFGIVEHAGTKGRHYPHLISDDTQMLAWIAKLEGKPVLKGIQAEGTDWMTCFSRDVIASLDYVLSDALTLLGDDGTVVEIWRPFDVGDKQKWMDRYTDFNVKVMAVEPIDIMANPTYLPDSLKDDFDALWTEKRMRAIVDAAVKYKVAIEINEAYRVPRMPFLKMAKDAGAKFSFGSNIHGLGVGGAKYAAEVVEALELEPKHIFAPAKRGKKPIQVRALTSEQRTPPHTPRVPIG